MVYLDFSFLLFIFRHYQKDVDWDVNFILEGYRNGFGEKGPKELAGEELIKKAAEGNYNRVDEILMDNLAPPDIADVHGYTALAAAAVRLHILLCYTLLRQNRLGFILSSML